jgi:Domain of unknown function (DUF4413)
MCGQTYPTLSSVIVLFNEIMDHLDIYRDGTFEENKMTTPPNDIIKAAEAAYCKIQDYYMKTNTLHCVVTLMDPRCKTEYFKQKGFKPWMINDYRKR